MLVLVGGCASIAYLDLIERSCHIMSNKVNLCSKDSK